MKNLMQGTRTTHSDEFEGHTSVRSGLRMATVLVPLSLVLTACAGLGGTTYGTGKSQEAELIGDVTSGFGLLGSDEEKAPIDYSARAGLVLPPKGTALPAPESRGKLASNSATNWPQDPDELRKIYQQRMATMTDQERQELLKAIRQLPAEQRNAIYRNDSAAFAQQIEEPDYSKGIDIVKENEYQRQVRKRLAYIKAQQGDRRTGRKYLTQPPEGIAEVTPEVQREIDNFNPEEEKKKKNFLRRLWPF